LLTSSIEKQPLISFACPHAFHLTCLLTYGTEAQVDTSNMAPYEDEYSSQERERGRELGVKMGVGPKVRLAKRLAGAQKVKDGCPVLGCNVG
jgi:hypothetical protein